MSNKDFSLVLSGGGALGFAHLGILEDLENANLSPSEIIGTSMGGLIAALFSIGLSVKQIEDRFKNLSGYQRWASFSLGNHALISTDKLESILLTTFGDTKISEAKIPLKIIATNFTNGDKTVFSSENDVRMVDAVLATIALPGIFPERKIDGLEFIDGAFSENLGITEASHDIILASDVLGRRSFKVNHNKRPFKMQSMMDSFEKSMRIMISNQTKNNLAKLENKRLFLSEINTRDFRTIQFKKVAKIKAAGKNEISSFISFMKHNEIELNDFCQ